jgi:DNA polymerase-3 subunit delta'
MAKEKQFELPHPRENPRAFGHEAAEARFLHEFNRGLIHHAYLMTGHKGIGKATLAYRFARFLLSQGAQKTTEAPSMSLFGDVPAASAPNTTSLDMSPDEPMFRRIAAGSHTDLLTLQPAYDAKKHTEKTIITVEEARKIPEFLSLTPAEGEWRVVIVDAVDQLNVNAANALLKILEEPPERSILLLVCHSPGGILPTIRSRCRTFKLTAPDEKSFGEILNHIAPDIPSHDYAALHALSYGAPGHAITLFEEDAIECYEGWLAAMMPDAGPATRQQFADKQAMRKTPASWDALIHCWQVAMQRLGTYPHDKIASPIFRREPEMLETIAAATPPVLRRAWVEQGNRLIRETETFNLDKRYTIRALADPGQLDMMAA